MPNRRTINNGYIKLFRKFFDGELWQEPRVYSKAEAWIDLIEMARWGDKPETLLDKRGPYILEYGDVYISLRYLGERWRWSKNKARHFLEYLESKESIVFKKRDSHRTIINLVNLRIYLGWESGKRDSEGTVEGQSRDSEGTKKKPLKPLKPEEPKEDIHSIFEFWNKQGIIIHRKFDSLKSNISAALKLYSRKEIEKAISNYSKVLKGDEFYWTYRWGLKDFLQRGLENFTEENKPLDNYKSKKEPEPEISTGGYDSPRYEIRS